MMTTICIMILAYCILGKNIKPLLGKIKNVDWHGKVNLVQARLQPYALKVGRVAARPLLQFFYVLDDPRTPLLDKALIYAALIYTISPINVLPHAVYRLLGILDEGAAVLYVLKKVSDKITPEINARVDQKLDEWFGTHYEMV